MAFASDSGTLWHPPLIQAHPLSTIFRTCLGQLPSISTLSLPKISAETSTYLNITFSPNLDHSIYQVSHNTPFIYPPFNLIFPPFPRLPRAQHETAMPYAPPSPTSSPSTLTNSTTASRPAHRHFRSRSSFSDERGPGAFASLGALPRRRADSTKKAVFHLNGGDEDSPPEQEQQSSNPQDSPQDSPLHASSPLPSPLTSLKLARAGRFSPTTLPPSRIDIPPFADPTASIPFPTQSPLPSPSLHPPHSHLFGHSSSYSSSGSSSSLPRTPSTPIILSNGKPLKSSLKSSSSPSIAGDFQRTKHLRAQSAPSTPNVHKNVHFAGEDDEGSPLTSVRVYKRSGKPASLNKPPGEETETETEAENGPSSGASSYPFPSFGSSSVSSSQPILHEIDPSFGATSPVPHPHPIPTSNVFLENITLPRTRPPTLRGTVLVRNVAFEKVVAVRFTLDEWTTTSEVLCKHVVSLPGLPPPFPREKKGAVDIATKIMNGMVEDEPNGPTWDRFRCVSLLLSGTSLN